jgi:hypothetical protein
MKTFTKILGAAILAGGAMLAVSQPASAAVSVGIGLGGGYYGPPAYSYSCDPYSRFYDPYRCGGYGYYGGPAYYGPSYYGYGGPSVVIGGRFGGGFHGGRGGFHGGGGHHR